MFIKAQRIIEDEDGTFWLDCYVNSDFISNLDIVEDVDNKCNVYTGYLTNDEDFEFEISESELEKITK